MALSTITVLIPAHNEEANIQRCVKSVISWADKVIVLSSSTDETDARSKALGAKIVRFDHDAMFPFLGVQRALNRGIDSATTDWVLRLDADEEVTPELKSEILDILSEDSKETVAYGVPRRQYFWGGFLKGGDWSYDRLVRFFRKDAARYNLESHVHEQFVVSGKQGVLQGALNHYSHPTLHIALQKFNLYTSSEISDLDLSFGQAVWKMIFRPIYVFLRWMSWNNGWRDGLRGIVAATFRGFYEFMLYSKYIEARFLKR